jgi:hypothetical protein
MKKNIAHFTRFLQDNDCIEAYTRALESESVNFNYYLMRSNPKSFVSGGFIWSATTEGYDFWSELNRKWWKVKDKPKIIISKI